MIPEELAGKRIALTGATGFLGTALTERLLRSVPECELVLLVRPGRRGASERVRREVLRNDAFDKLRSHLGKDRFDTETQRIAPVSADISIDGLNLSPQDLELLAACDVFIHAAAAVAFDNPFDLAVETNLLGPVRIMDLLRENRINPHFISISTAYVAGNRRGSAPEKLLSESPFAVEMDWSAEAVAASRTRASLEDASRTPEQLKTFAAQADGELGAAGTAALSSKREQIRRRWVQDQLVEAGRARAASLGFPDAYGLTKALAENALVETRGGVPLTIVRPSIIESALSEPFPGWIRGFRMAEPIIISYARGLLADFPGTPEGILDVIPVDLVAAAVCAVAADGPPPGGETRRRAGGLQRRQPPELQRPPRLVAHLVQREPHLQRAKPTPGSAPLVVSEPQEGADSTGTRPAGLGVRREGAGSASHKGGARRTCRRPGGEARTRGAGAQLR